MLQIRTTKPTKGNKFYITTTKGGWSTCISGSPTDKDCNVLANCVGYACGRFNEIIGEMKYNRLHCNAENFIERAKSIGLEVSRVPTLGGIMVWQKGKTLSGNDGAGHVAIVEKIIDDNTIYTSESAYGGSAFFNATRSNKNGRWGLSSGYIFRGCIVNPSLGKVTTPTKEEYTNGNYQTLYIMNVRSGAGTSYAQKKVKDLTNDGQKNATSTNKNALASYKKGTIFTALSIITKSDKEVWAKTPSGYVAIVYNGIKHCKKI